MFNPNIPQGIRSTIMKAFIRHLKEHPLLSSVIKTFDDYNGTAHDHAIIPLEKCPAIRFTYSAPSQSPQTFTSTTADFSIAMEVIVPGTNQYVVLDLWELMEVAIDQFVSGEKSIRSSLAGDQRAIFGTHYISSPAINHAKYKNPPCMIGTGSVNITLSIRR